MSFHYEVTFSLFLRDDTPVEVLDELRWHLGQSSERPEICVVDYDGPVLLPAESSPLAGGEVATLQRQYRFTQNGAEHFSWGVHARLYWLDDHWAEVWWQVATWLAPYADDGYAGFFREENDEQPTLLLMRSGEPYFCKVGGEPQPFSS